MRLKRRDFLALSGLGLLGIVGWKKLLPSNIVETSNPLITSPVLPPDPSTTVAVTPNKPLLKFVAVADTGTGDRNQYAVADVMTRYHQQNPYSTVILAGDNIYTNGEFEKIQAVFEQPYQTLLQQNVKFYACLGNHDIRTQNGELQIRYPNFNMSGRYYSFQQGPVQFFALDTNPSAPWKEQLAWLDRELSSSKSPWKVVFGHHPIYSSGRYGSDQGMIQALTPLFEKYRVQLYINGHEHDYELTRPINGTTYLITGIGGAGLRPVGTSEWTDFSASEHGFTALDVYIDRIELAAIDTNNQVFDRGTIRLKG